MAQITLPTRLLRPVWYGLGLAGLLLVLTFTALAAQGLSAQPQGVRLYLPAGGDPAYEVGVVWTTEESTTESVVEFGSTMGLGQSVQGYSTPLPGSSWDGRLHYANLTGLAPATTYYYRAGDGTGNFSEVYNFTTLSEPLAGTSLSIGIFGRMGSGPQAEAVAAALANGSLEALLSPGGLALANGSDHGAWEAWADLAANFSTGRLLLPGAGGPDVAGTAEARGWALQRLPPLAVSSWYEARLGGLQVLVVDGSAGLDPGDPQREWLRARLAAGWVDPVVRWRLVSLYESPYSSGTAQGSNLTLRGTLEPLLTRYPGTLLVSAADGHYERSHPLANGSLAGGAANATTYIVVGHGGANLGGVAEPRANWSAVAANDSQGYLIVTLHPNGTLEGRAPKLDGGLADTFWYALPPRPRESSATPRVVEGEPVVLNGTAPGPGMELRWLTESGEVALEGGNGSVWLANGTHQLFLQARWPNSSWSVPLAFTVTVNGRPRAAIVSAPTLLNEGQAGTFIGAGYDDGAVAGYEWRSDREGLLSVEAAFTTSALSNSTHNLSFWVLDNEWVWSAPVSLELRVNGLPVVGRPQPQAVQVYRGQSTLLTFSGFDDATSDAELAASLRYRDPGGYLGTDFLGPLTYNTSRRAWQATFTPLYTAPLGAYHFQAELEDLEGGSSGWREGPALTVVNNDPAATGLGATPDWLLPGQPTRVWATGLDLETTPEGLTPALEYRRNGSGPWQAAPGQFQWVASRARHELDFTPPEEDLPATFDLRVRLTDPDGGVSGWRYANETVQVTALRLGTLAATVYRTGSAVLWANLTDPTVASLSPALAYRLEGAGEGDWAGAWLGSATYNSSQDRWRFNFTPPAAAPPGLYQFNLTFTNASAQATSSPRVAVLLEVLNNPPAVMEVGTPGGGPATVRRQDPVSLWAKGTDLEDSLANLTLRLRYRPSGSSDPWLEAWPLTTTFNITTDRWEAELVVPARADLGYYELEAAFTDSDNGTSDWTPMAESLNLLNRVPVALNLTAEPTAALRNGSLVLAAEGGDEVPDLLVANFQVQPTGGGNWEGDWFDPPQFIQGRWRALLRPPPTAVEGLYWARVNLTDPEGNSSGWLVAQDLFRLDNSPPILLNFSVSNQTPLRNSTLTLSLNATDYETPAGELQVVLQHRPLALNSSWEADWVGPARFNTSAGGWEISLSIPPQIELGPYGLRARVTDGEGTASDWWELEPAFTALNSPPLVVKVNVSAGQVNRTSNVALWVTATDTDDTSAGLKLNLSLAGPGDTVYKNQPELRVEVLGSDQSVKIWEVSFTPPLSAPLGPYTLRVQVTDRDNATSAPLVREGALEVRSSPPYVTGLELEPEAVLRGRSFNVTLTGGDAESPLEKLTVQLGQRVRGSVVVLPWASQPLLLPGSLRLEVAVLLEASLGRLGLYGRLADEEGGLSAWYGPVNLTILNNPPILEDYEVGGRLIRTRPVMLNLTGHDVEDPPERLVMTLRLTPLAGGNSSYFTLTGSYDSQKDRLVANFTPAASLALGTYGLDLTLRDSDGDEGRSPGSLEVTVENSLPVVASARVQQLGDYLYLNASALDRDGQVTKYHWQVKGGPYLGSENNLTYAAVKVGPGLQTFLLVVEDNDGGLSGAYEVVLEVAAVVPGPDRPWLTARLIGVMVAASIALMGLGGLTVRSYHATQRELAKLPPFLVEQAFLVSWEGKPVAHVGQTEPAREEGRAGARSMVGAGVGVDLQMAREVLEGARELRTASPGRLGYLGSTGLESGPLLLVVAGRSHFVALVCLGRPQQPLWQAAEGLLQAFEGRLAHIDGQMVKPSVEERAGLSRELNGLLAPTQELNRARLRARLGLRQLEVETSLLARRGRYLWQIEVVNQSRFDLRKGELRLDWPPKLVRGPPEGGLVLPLIGPGQSESFLVPLEPQSPGTGACRGELVYQVPGRREQKALEARELKLRLPALVSVGDTAAATRLLEAEGAGDRTHLTYPLPELLRGELVARHARAALHKLGLRPLPDLAPDEPGPGGAARIEDSAWGGQDPQGELLVARLTLVGTELRVGLAAERSATLVAAVATFKQGFKAELGEVYEVVAGDESGGAQARGP